MDRLLALVALQRQAEEAESKAAFYHVVVNHCGKVIPCAQALIWTNGVTGPSLEKISGHAILDPNGPYALDLIARINDLGWTKGNVSTENPKPVVINAAGQAESLSRLFVPLRTNHDGLMGGILLERAAPFAESEILLAGELGASCAPILELHMLRDRGRAAWSVTRFFRSSSRTGAIAAGACLALFFCPVRMSVTAPVEIVPVDPVYVTAPFDGLIASVEVAPSAPVSAGDILLRFDETVLKSDMDLAEQELAMAQSSLSRLSRESLSAPEKKADLGALDSAIREKKIRYEYTRSILERGRIVSPARGVAIFPDKSVLEGHPVHAGDVLMKIADPSKVEAMIRVPVDSMIEMGPTSEVGFFLNVHPSRRYKAEILTTGYEAGHDPDGLVTYKIRASVVDAPERLDIGWTGTAKIRAGWTMLGLDILRRPFVVFRQITGW